MLARKKVEILARTSSKGRRGSGGSHDYTRKGEAPRRNADDFYLLVKDQIYWSFGCGLYSFSKLWQEAEEALDSSLGLEHTHRPVV
jgi:hypothetical protein